MSEQVENQAAQAGAPDAGSAPVAFMVMPFDVKPTGRAEPGVPAEVDFDRLWHLVYTPVLAGLGYRPVRADADLGSLIITEMIERLVFGDLVVADLTLANPNVYYEVGVRHAAVDEGCLLTAADWARPVFDLAQMRRVDFPLPDGSVGETAAAAARAVLADRLRAALPGASPVFASVPGYPTPDDRHRVTFTDLVRDMLSFDADVRAAYLAPRAQQAAAAEAVRARHGDRPAVRQADVLQMVRMLRDLVGFRSVLDHIATLPPHVRRHPLVQEQRCLALSEVGEPAVAAAQLEQLIAADGPSPERLGLLGGRYKRLMRDAGDGADRWRYLDLAIDSYEKGMQADLNAYYPASNLPRLYRQRGAVGDEARAREAEVLTVVACRRAIERGTADEWVRPTLLGLAFDRGDVPEAQRLLREVAREGHQAWKLTSTLDDLAGQLDHHDRQVADQLRAVLEGLRSLLPPAAQPAGGTG